MIVSFVVYFKTPVTENEGLAKLRDAVDSNKKLGNFTADALEVIQVNPTTAANERSTGNPSNSLPKGNLTVKKERDILGPYIINDHDVDGVINFQKSIGLISKHNQQLCLFIKKLPCHLLWSM